MLAGFFVGLVGFILLFGLYLMFALFLRPRKKSSKQPFCDRSIVRLVVAVLFVWGLFNALTEDSVATLLPLTLWGYLFYRFTRNATALARSINDTSASDRSSESSHSSPSDRSSSSGGGGSSFGGFGGGSSGGGGSTSKW